MRDDDVETRVGKFVDLCEKAPPSERLSLKPVVDRTIRTLKSRHLLVPSRLNDLKARLEDEAYEDLFDNMPV
jgi:hypothetical protein